MEVADTGLRSADNTENCYLFFFKKEQFRLGARLLAGSWSSWGPGTCFWSLFSPHHTCKREDIQVFDTLQPQPRKSSPQQGNAQGLTLLCHESASETYPNETNTFSLHHHSFFNFKRKKQKRKVKKKKREMLYWNRLTYCQTRTEKCSCHVNFLPKILSLSENPSPAMHKILLSDEHL